VYINSYTARTNRQTLLNALPTLSAMPTWVIITWPQSWSTLHSQND